MKGGVAFSSCQDGESFSKASHSLFTGLLSEGVGTLLLFGLSVYFLRLILGVTGMRLSCGESLLKGLSVLCMKESQVHFPKNAKVEAPLIWSVFLLILGFNLLGLIPVGFVISAQIYFVLPLALLLWASLVLKGLWEGRIFSKSLLLSSAAPRALALPLMLLELVGHFIRPLTLTARLSVNIMAGHILFKTLMAASYKAFLFKAWMGVGVYALAMLFFAAEIVVCFIQAYVFFILLSVYLNEYSAPTSS
nr:ATP synthase F0 subunit 6 [Glottidia pyramidata]